MYGLMRNIIELSYCILPLDCCRMIPLMLSLAQVLLWHFSVLRLDSRTLFIFKLEHRPPSRIFHLPLFRLVHQLKILWILIELLQQITVHLFLVYPDGLPKQLKLPQLFLEMFPSNDKLEFKRNMSSFAWWLLYLKLLIMFPTKMLKDDLNGRNPCKPKLIMFRRITLRTWFPNHKERKLWSVDGSTEPNLPLKVLLSDINHAYLQRYFLNKKELNTLRSLPLLQRWTLFRWFFPLLLILDGKSIRWMWRVHLFMETYLNKFSWNNHLVFWQILTWCVVSRSQFMVWSKIHGPSR